MNLPKTILTVAGHDITADDGVPITVLGGKIECVEEFPYLGSLILLSGWLDAQKDRRITSASRAFGAFHRPIFDDGNLTVTMKKMYNSCMLSVLHYGRCCYAQKAE